MLDAIQTPDMQHQRDRRPYPMARPRTVDCFSSLRPDRGWIEWPPLADGRHQARLGPRSEAAQPPDE
jgi:hypothetical protein